MITNETNYKIKLKGGDNILLREFYYHNYSSFCSYAAHFITDEYEIEDIVQESFIAFWELDNEFTNLDTVKTFFYTSIRNSCLDKIKHERVKSKFIELQTRIIETKDFFLESVLKQEVYSYIHQQIGTLSSMEKKVILMALNDKSNKEIAEKLGIKLNTVKTYKQRAYKILREKIRNFIFYILSIS
ncbi:sigma-70 family RNA polymerase sigma factor [uncultured Draconibacterium sp.]|uniref:sigma-70 family RNA polymerase sigma factor n=1 Tax=uncultured Draconibacterium sp. TaxID=1573823 RepID=UPI002AA71E5D|nr:sigma-70 family RNA polymerase sigma factor [uncultured Draconibacterium sp.]